MNIESIYKAFLKFSKGSIKKDGFNLHITNIGKDNKDKITFYFDKTYHPMVQNQNKKTCIVKKETLRILIRDNFEFGRCTRIRF